MEAGLVALLCLHGVFGCRVLAIEWASRRETDQPANMRWGWIPLGLIAAALTGLLYTIISWA